MNYIEEQQWTYNKKSSYEANRSSWIDACNFERSRYNEEILTPEQAEMKFSELYPRSDYERD